MRWVPWLKGHARPLAPRFTVSVVWMLALGVPGVTWAQGETTANSVRIRVDTLGPGLTVLSSVHGKLLVRAVADEIFVAGTPAPEFAQALHTLVMGKRQRWAVLFFGDSAVANGDGSWGALESLTIAHESLRGLLWAAAHDTTLRVRPSVPRLGFSEVMQVSLQGDEAHIVHQPRAYSAADAIVHLEGSQVLVMGNLYRSDGFPAIAIKAGGRFNGLIDVVSTFVSMFGNQASVKFVPSSGPVTTGTRLREYRDMLVTVRQRVLEAITRGATEDEVSRSGIANDFEEEWGHGAVPKAQFLRTAYQSLVRDSASRPVAPLPAPPHGQHP